MAMSGPHTARREYKRRDPHLRVRMSASQSTCILLRGIHHWPGLRRIQQVTQRESNCTLNLRPSQLEWLFQRSGRYG